MCIAFLSRSSLSLNRHADRPLDCFGQDEKEAQNNLGILFRDGLGVKQDIKRALNYFQAATGQDLAEAQVNLAKYHLCAYTFRPAFLGDQKRFLTLLPLAICSSKRGAPGD